MCQNLSFVERFGITGYSSKDFFASMLRSLQRSITFAFIIINFKACLSKRGENDTEVSQTLTSLFFFKLRKKDNCGQIFKTVILYERKGVRFLLFFSGNYTKDYLPALVELKLAGPGKHILK